MVLASVSRVRISLTNVGMGRELGLGPVPFSKHPSRSASLAIAEVVARVGAPEIASSMRRAVVHGDASARSAALEGVGYRANQSCLVVFHIHLPCV